MRVTDYDIKRQRITCMLYKSLNRIYWDNSINNWWWLSHNDPSITKMCVSIVRLLISPGKHLHKICEKCSTFQINDYEHILFKCPYNESSRKLLWMDFVDACPIPMEKDINAMEIRKRTNFLLNALNGAYTKEWHHIYMFK